MHIITTNTNSFR